MITVTLPYHLRNLAGVEGDVQVDVEGPATIKSVLDAVEKKFPVLRGTIRFHDTDKRRPWIRFFACEQDLSHDPPESPLPEKVVNGEEPFFIIGAIAGG